MGNVPEPVKIRQLPAYFNRLRQKKAGSGSTTLIFYFLDIYCTVPGPVWRILNRVTDVPWHEGMSPTFLLVQQRGQWGAPSGCWGGGWIHQPTHSKGGGYQDPAHWGQLQLYFGPRPIIQALVVLYQWNCYFLNLHSFVQIWCEKKIVNP